MPLIDNIKHKNKPTRYYSRKQEKRTANLLGGTATKNSGATMFQKGDVYDAKGNFQIECKTKEKPCESFSIKKEWLEKNLEETLITGKKYSVLAFNFGPNEPNYYVIDEKLMSDIVDRLKG